MGNYFNYKNAWKHLFFVTGLTADEFFTDSGMKMDIEQFTHLELKKSGYQRIVFFDKDFKLYCYDDESFELLTKDGLSIERDKKTSAKRRKRNGGLKMGKHASVETKKKTEGIAQSEKDAESDVKDTDNEWETGENSKINIKKIHSEVLHLGVHNDDFVKSHIDSYVEDSLIKTAVVINNPTSFRNEFRADFMHSLTSRYERLHSENENIIVLLYTDIELKNLYEVMQLDTQDDNHIDTNIINISNPNSLEVKNMLMYLRLNRKLKFRMTDLDRLSVELCRAMTISKKRTKETLMLIDKEMDRSKFLDVDKCYELLGKKRPRSASEQLQNMIGMQNVKKVISSFNVNENNETAAMEYLTVSRLAPDKEKPVKKSDEMIHFLLRGNPGTGKTSVARLIGQLFYEMGYLEKGHVVETDRSDLVAGYVGQTAVKTRQRIEEALGGVLFIDEAYSLKRTKNTGNDFGQEVIDTLCKWMDAYKGKFIVVAAGYPDEMETFINSNPGFSSRFTYDITLEDYTPEEMLQIFRLHARENQAVFSEELEKQLPDFFENLVNQADETWGNAREAVNLVDGMIRNWKSDKEHKIRNNENNEEEMILEAKHIPDKLKENLRPVSESRAQMLEKLSNMIGLKGVKEKINTIWNRGKTGTLQNPGNYLFIGNPGTGKTTIARLMGRMLRDLGLLKRGHTIEYTAAELMSVVFNDENQGNFETVANKALNGVLFIDEAYQLQSDITGRGKPIIDSLLTFVENKRDKVCVILAGYEDDIDKLLKENNGFTRRFPETNRIHFDNYSGAELCDILMGMLAENGMTADEEYKEAALRALTSYVNRNGKRKDFGNAGYVRDEFMQKSIDAQAGRLVNRYGDNIPDELKNVLTADDIPEDLKNLSKVPLEKPDNRSAIEIIDSLIGYEKIKSDLKKMIKNAKFNQNNELGIVGKPGQLHWILKGSPGTGKTTIAKLIGKVYKECGILPKGHTVKVTRSDLVAKYVGQTAPKTRKCIEEAMGGVLFIDEAYSLTKGEAQGGGFGAEAINELVEAMTDHAGEFAVVCAGYPDDMEEFKKSNPGLCRRMKEFILEDYTPAELAKIFLLKCEEEKTEPDENLLSLLELFFYNKKQRESKIRDWGNGGEAENLLQEIINIWIDNPVYNENKTKRVITVDHIPEDEKKYLKGKLPSKNKETSAMEDINNLIGFANVKEKLLDLINLKKTSVEQGREDLFDDMNYHWILKGNPGTGKTTVAKLVGKVYKELGLLSRGHTIKVTYSEMVAEYVGQSAPKTRKCIERAMGGILFIEEAYMLTRNDFGREAIETLLEQMSEKNGEFAVIAVGYPKEMDVFLRSNPGFKSRFDEIFLLEDYNADELLEIFELKCRKKKFYLKDDFKDVIKTLFQNMIDARIKDWANGREAENLERKMRIMWPKKPVSEVDEDTGEKISYYTAEHIPEEYRKYLSGSNSAVSKDGKKSNLPVKNENFSISSKILQPVAKNFKFEEKYLEQVQSVVFIRAINGESIKSGTGSFITNDGHILTCCHVINGSTEIHVRIKPYNGDNGTAKWEIAELIWQDENLDMAVLKIKEGGYLPLSIRTPETKTVPGEGIYLWGFPFGSKLSDDLDQLQPSLFQGSISSVQIRGGLERINANMEAKRGCSGGPVFSKNDGSIIGILCGSQTEGDEGLIEEINFIRPVKYIWEKVINMQK